MQPERVGRWLLGRGGFVVRLVLVLACLPSAHLAQTPLDETRVKAAFVYNFAKFVEWPDESRSPAAAVLVGVIGDPQLAAVLSQTLRDKQVRGHPFEVRYFQSQDELALCHILMVASQDKALVQNILHVARAAPTLTIGEIPGFSDWGGVIELVLDGNKFRFEINAGVAHRGGLKISSRLLRLARAVKETDAP
jgi:YfiR/HmsC-like